MDDLDGLIRSAAQLPSGSAKVSALDEVHGKVQDHLATAADDDDRAWRALAFLRAQRIIERRKIGEEVVGVRPAEEPPTSPPRQVSRKPLAIVADRLFSDAECELLISLAMAHGLKPAQVGHRMGMDGQVSEIRRADTHWMTIPEFKVYDDTGVALGLVERLWAFARLPREHAEALLFVRYDPEGFYGLHNDTAWSDTFDSDSMRIATLLLYLREPDVGAENAGHTVLPLADAPESVLEQTRMHWTVPDPHHPSRRAVHRSKMAPYCAGINDPARGGVRIAPKRGSAAFWWNADFTNTDRYERRAVHGACPDSEGKIIAQIWFRRKRAVHTHDEIDINPRTDAYAAGLKRLGPKMWLAPPVPPRRRQQQQQGEQQQQQQQSMDAKQRGKLLSKQAASMVKAAQTLEDEAAEKKKQRATAEQATAALVEAESLLQEAAVTLQLAAAVRPKDHRVRNNLGVVLMRLKRPAEALLRFNEALDLKPSYSAAKDNAADATKAVKKMKKMEKKRRRSKSREEL
eukprot:g1511.t1